jgi:glycosyltransferase involved in cell wall biosynthesis
VPTTGIVHQIDPRHPVYGGIETCIEGIVRYAPPGEMLILVGADRGGDRTIPLGTVEWYERDGRRVGFLPVATLARSGRSGWVPETARLVAGLVRFRRAVRESTDTLQVHRSETGAVVALILGALPRVQCIHGDSDRALRHPSVSYWRFLRSLHLAVERWSVKRARHTFVFSKSGAHRLQLVSPEVSYLPTWYDPSLVLVRTEPRRDHGARVLWVGRFEEEKDPLLALGTLRAFVAGADDRVAVMVGDGSLLAAVRAACSDETRVSFRGSLAPREVAQEMADADILLMTSRFEGSPVVMNEALAAGTPVVCTEESDPDGRIEQERNGVRVAGREAEELAAAIEVALGLDRSACVASVRDLAAPSLVPRVFELAAESSG